MTVRLAVPAMGTRHGRLDDARIAAARDVELTVADAQSVRIHIEIRQGPKMTSGPLPRDRFTHEQTEFVLGHSCTSTASMMPMIAASTGAPFAPIASFAARPSITTSTFSWT